MYDIDNALSWESLRELITRTILPVCYIMVFVLFVVALVWNKSIQNLLPVFNYQRGTVA